MRRAVLLVVVVLVTVIASDLTGFADLSGLPHARAQTGGGYDLTWSTMDSGGDMFSAGGGHGLGGTIGQPDASAWSSGGYTLAGGFWGGETMQYSVYLPLALRN